MLQRNFVIGGVVGFLLLSVAAAQERPGPGPGGPGRATIHPWPFGPIGSARADMLLARAEVQKELGLSDEQKTQLKTLAADTLKQFQSTMGKFNFRDASQEEREKHIAEMRKKTEDIGKLVEEKVAKILDAKQRERLGQLRLQLEGLAALHRPAVVKKLALSDEQQAKIKKILEENRPLAFRPGKSADGGPGDFLAELKKRREKTESEVLAVLSDAQKTKWSEMKGKEFKFARQAVPFAHPGGGFGGGEFHRPAPPPRPEKSEDKD